MTSAVSPADARPVPRIDLHRLDVPTIAALAAGDARSAAESSGLKITSFLAGDRALWVWQLTVAGGLDPDEQRRWLACAVIDVDLDVVVGHAGFHGPPRDGMVEIGYSIDPERRRRGYGRAAVAALVAQAQSCPAVDRIRASINRSNTASFATIAGFGFRQTGERAVGDGHETILERPVLLDPLARPQSPA